MENDKRALALMLCCSFIFTGCGFKKEESGGATAAKHLPAEQLTDFDLSMAKCSNPWREDGTLLRENNERLNDPLLSHCYRLSVIGFQVLLRG